MKEQEGTCSLFKIGIKPNSKAYRYDVDVYLFMDRDRSKNMNKGADE